MTSTGKPYNSPFEAQFDEGRAQLFVIQQLLRGVHTCDVVRVLGVQPTGGRVGFVTVQPVTLDTDTGGVVLEQAPIYNVPYIRYQAGASAVIMDPEKGDIGIAFYAERDITTFKKTLQDGPPATDRTHSSADGLYIGGVLNGDPTQFVRFKPGAGGIDVHTPGDLNLSAAGAMNLSATGTLTLTAGGGIVLASPVTFQDTAMGTKTGSGNYSFAGPLQAPDFIAPNANLNTHIHSDPQGGNTGGPHN